jgi:arsenical-resistance protein 2
VQTLIPGAINIPAQSIAASATTLVDVLSHIDLVVFYCSQSKGRGPRAAGWYADALEKALPPQAIVSDRVAILKGGIVAWEAEYGCGDITQRGGLAPSDTCGIRHL